MSLTRLVPFVINVYHAQSFQSISFRKDCIAEFKKMYQGRYVTVDVRQEGASVGELVYRVMRDDFKTLDTSAFELRVDYSLLSAGAFAPNEFEQLMEA